MDSAYTYYPDRKIYSFTKIEILKLSLFIYLYLQKHLSFNKEKLAFQFPGSVKVEVT